MAWASGVATKADIRRNRVDYGKFKSTRPTMTPIDLLFKPNLPNLAELST